MRRQLHCKTSAGSQRYRSMYYGGSKLELKLQGYAESLHKRAVEMDVDGMNLRKILRHLKVHQRPAALWVINYADAVLDLLVPDKVKELEKEEPFFHRR
jgi:hypothetical protein